MSDAKTWSFKRLVCYDLRRVRILECGVRASGIRQMSANRGASCRTGIFGNYGTISKGIPQAYAACDQIPGRFIP